MVAMKSEYTPIYQQCSRCPFICYFDEMPEHHKQHQNLAKMPARKRRNLHTVLPCPFGDYISRSGNLTKHMMKEHGHYATMTKWHSLPKYKEMYPTASASVLKVMMVRDWKLGTILGLNAMRLPLKI